jgi:amino acid adenylation domain-containing protein
MVDRLRPTGGRQAEGFAREGVRLSEDLTEDLWSFARSHDITVNTLVQGAWALLLSRYSGRPDVVFGVTRSGRHTSPAGTTETVGMLVNSLPFRIQVPPNETPVAWLQEIRRQAIAMRDYEHTPLERVREWSGLPPGMAPFDSLLAYDHEPPDATLRRLGGNWESRKIRRIQRTDVPLTLVAYGRPVLSLEVVFDTRQYSREMAAGMVGHLETLLRSFLEQPDGRLSALNMLTEGERKEFFHVRRRSFAGSDWCAHQLVEDQARRTATKTALEYSGGSISYEQMNQRANQLAWFLREAGAGPEDVIGVCLDRSPEAYIAVLAVLKAGAAFLPMDTGFPPVRLAAILEHTQAKVVLTGDAQLDLLGGCACEVINLDRMRDAVARQPAENLPALATPDNAAYAIHTSGSTGTPKALVITHRSLVNHTLAASEWFEISEADRRLQFASMGTDMFIAEMFNNLACGATVVFGWNRATGSVREFLRMLEQQRISITGMPAAWFSEWVAALPLDGFAPPRSLRAVVVGMERVNPAAFLAWKKAVGGRIRWFNAYGPAEATATSTIYEAGSSAWEGTTSVPIGKPLVNTSVYVLDPDRNPLPAGVPGELYIGGAGVGRGYLNSPELTARSFLPDFLSREPGGRLYRTGDLGFSLPDSNLVFLGRIDRQVKVRGFRVELEEIEAVLAGHAGVRQCAVVQQGGEANRRLVAYFTPSAGRAPSPGELRLHLSRHVPDYMLPAAFVALPEMPLTAGGKIDRQSLPECTAGDFLLERGHEEPSTETEKRLAAIWKEVLCVSRVGETDDFFELGGDSLRCARLITLIQKEFGKELPLTALVQAPTVARMALVLEEDGGVTTAAASCETVIPLQPHGSLLPLFCISSDADDPLCFRPLAKFLGDDRPVLAIANPIEDCEREQSVEELAARVCRSIRGSRPKGPYVLGGYCLGGIVAFEAARQLISAGEEVRLVVLFDTPTPAYPRFLRGGAHYWRQWRARFLATRSGFGRWGGNVPDSYNPEPLAVSVAHFVAQEEALGTRILRKMVDSRLGWRELCQGEFWLHRVRGSHSTLFLETHAMDLAAELSEILRKIE